MKDKMFFFFPQWQGTGRNQAILNGAKAIKEVLSKKYVFKQLPDFCPNTSLIKKGIKHYDALIGNLKQAHQLFEKEGPKFVFTLGGDCSIEIAPISYLYQKHQHNLSLFWLDAHSDLNTISSSPTGHLHGMPVRILLGEGEPNFVKQTFAHLGKDDLLLVGIRDMDPPETAFIEKQRINFLTIEQLENDFENSCQKIKSLTKDKIYLHFDVDVLDPKEVSTVMCLANHGLSKKTLLKLIDFLKNNKQIVGMGMTEFSGQDKANVNFFSDVFSSVV